MKATQKDFKSLAARAAKEASVFFFCGPDEAGANDAAHVIAGLLSDPGERIELAGGELKRDPVRLGDEARSTSLFGESRHIWVRAAGDEAHDAVANLIADDVPGCPVLIVATGASDKSRTAKLLAARGDALVAMFYPPDLKSVTDAVRQMAGPAGLRLGGDLAERIARGAALDTRLAQSEVTKLALYLDASPASPRNAEPEHLDAIGARIEEDGFADVVNIVLSGQTSKVAGELQRMREVGLSAVGVLLALERRAGQLAQLTSRMGPRGDVSSFLNGEKAARRIFWKEQRDLEIQMRTWRGKRLARLVDRLVALHRALLANSQSAELLLAQELTEIARAAAPRS